MATGRKRNYSWLKVVEEVDGGKQEETGHGPEEGGHGQRDGSNRFLSIIPVLKAVDLNQKQEE